MVPFPWFELADVPNVVMRVPSSKITRDEVHHEQHTLVCLKNQTGVYAVMSADNICVGYFCPDRFTF